MNEMQHHPEMQASTDSVAAPVRPMVTSRYVICLVLLLVSAAGMQVSANYFAAYFKKEGLPLQLALSRMAFGKLAPDYSLALQQPRPLSEELIESLGTKEYLSCFLADSSVEPLDRTHYSKLFVTYYTGQPDMVPHAPRECQQAAGFALKEAQLHTLKLLDHRGNEVELPMEVLVFDRPDGGDPVTVIFFFYANGEYVVTREGVRVATADLFDRYAYYAKLELSFSNRRGAPASKEESIASADKLLRKLMPVLWKDHFPDWEAATAGSVAAAGKDS